MILKGICAAAILLTTVCSVGWSNEDVIGIQCSTQDFTRNPTKTPCNEFSTDDPLVVCESNRSSNATSDKCGVKCMTFLKVSPTGHMYKAAAFDGDENTLWKDLTADQKKAVKDKCNNESQCEWNERASACANKAQVWPEMTSDRQSPKAGKAAKTRSRANTR